MPEALAAIPAVLAAGAGTAADVGAGALAAGAAGRLTLARALAPSPQPILRRPHRDGPRPRAGGRRGARVRPGLPAFDIGTASVPGLGRLLDAGCDCGGCVCRQPDIGGSFADLRRRLPLSDFAGAAGAGLAVSGGRVSRRRGRGGSSFCSCAADQRDGCPSCRERFRRPRRPARAAGARLCGEHGGSVVDFGFGREPGSDAFQVAGVNAPAGFVAQRGRWTGAGAERSVPQ